MCLVLPGLLRSRSLPSTPLERRGLRHTGASTGGVPKGIPWRIPIYLALAARLLARTGQPCRPLPRPRRGCGERPSTWWAPAGPGREGPPGSALGASPTAPAPAPTAAPVPLPRQSAACTLGSGGKMGCWRCGLRPRGQPGQRPLGPPSGLTSFSVGTLLRHPSRASPWGRGQASPVPGRASPLRGATPAPEPAALLRRPRRFSLRGVLQSIEVGK